MGDHCEIGEYCCLLLWRFAAWFKGEGKRFYRAMHFSAYALSWDRMSSVRLSICLSVCL